MKHIKGLDTLRAFAVCSVIISHLGFYFDDNDPSRQFIFKFIVPEGGFGVYLFFVLSGFLITSILLNAAQEVSNKFATAGNFFARRALRIFPIYYLTVLVLYVIDSPHMREDTSYYLFYASNILAYKLNNWPPAIGHTWTLSVEEQFYLLWPWLIVFTNKKQLMYVFCGAILVGIASTYVVMNVYGKFGPLLVFNCFDAFGIGGMYAFCRSNDKYRRRFEKAIFMIVPVAIVAFYYWKYLDFVHLPAPGSFMVKTVYSVISMWIIILTINCREGWFKRNILENRTLNFIGMISYGLYVYHIPVSDLLNQNYYKLLSSLGFTPLQIHDLSAFNFYYTLKITILFIFSWLSYKYFEKPILSLKNKFSYRQKKPSEQPVAPEH